MVKLVTEYTTQIYHALSTDARPTVEPGDLLREIDTGKRFIFDGTSWMELSDGGGGGGIPESGFIDYHSITVRWAKVKTGVNTVSYTDGVLPYLMGLAGFSNDHNIATAFSIDPDVTPPYNTIGASDKIVYNYSSRHVYRYRAGRYTSVAIANNYDGIIPADTFYYIFVIEEVAP